MSPTDLGSPLCFFCVAQFWICSVSKRISGTVCFPISYRTSYGLVRFWSFHISLGSLVPFWSSASPLVLPPRGGAHHVGEGNWGVSWRWDSQPRFPNSGFINLHFSAEFEAVLCAHTVFGTGSWPAKTLPSTSKDGVKERVRLWSQDCDKAGPSFYGPVTKSDWVITVLAYLPNRLKGWFKNKEQERLKLSLDCISVMES